MKNKIEITIISYITLVVNVVIETIFIFKTIINNNKHFNNNSVLNLDYYKRLCQKYFHHNGLGHENNTAFVIKRCGDEFKCSQTDGCEGYANPAQINENPKKLCRLSNQAKAPANTAG